MTRRKSAQSAGPGMVIYASLGRLAVALGLIPLFKLWLGIHLYNKQRGGAGWFIADKAFYSALCDLTGLSYNRMRVLLADGQGLWWHADLRHAGRYHLVGQAAIAAYLSSRAAAAGVPDAYERPNRCEMPAEALRCHFTAELLATWIGLKTGEHGYQARWQDLTALWGLSRGQLRRLIAQAGIEAEKSHAVINLPGVKPGEGHKIDAGYSGIPHAFAGEWLGGVYLYYRRANRWHGPQRRCTRPGKAGKLQRAIRKCASGIGCKLLTLSDLDGATSRGRLTATHENIMGQAGEQFPVVTLEDAWKPRTNYFAQRPFRLARRKRPEATLYALQFKVWRGQGATSVYWAAMGGIR